METRAVTIQCFRDLRTKRTLDEGISREFIYSATLGKLVDVLSEDTTCKFGS